MNTDLIIEEHKRKLLVLKDTYRQQELKKELVKLYTDRIMVHVIYWIKAWKMTESGNCKVSEDDLKELKYKMIMPIIADIIEEDNEIMLTNDLCFYLIYCSLTMLSDYREAIADNLNFIRGMNQKGMIGIVEEYMKYMCYAPTYNDCDKKNHARNLELMNDDVRSCYELCRYIVHNKIGYNGHSYKYAVLNKILFHIYGYCYINHKLNAFSDLIRKYFKDPDKTVEHMVNNGFVKLRDDCYIKTYTVEDIFDDYLERDMYKSDNNKEIK